MSKAAKRLLFFTLPLLILLSVLAPQSRGEVKALDPHSWTQASRGLVAHGGGGILNLTVSNCYEALEANYRLGHRVFEIDLNLTSDGELAAVHDWYWSGYFGPVTLSEFKGRKIAGVYTSMSLEDVYQFMEVHKDAYLITDTKSFEYSEAELLLQFKLIYEKAQSRSPELLSRVIPQIYNQRMYDLITGIYPFQSIIYTLYVSNDTDAQVVDFVKGKSDIKAVTMPEARYSKGFYDILGGYGKLIYLHTLNSIDVINAFRRQGVHGFYTDFVIPAQIDGNAAATPTASPVFIDSRRAGFAAYNINGNNYFKLRDIAYALSGTEKQFEVVWNAADNAISLISGETYTPLGGEMDVAEPNGKTAMPVNPKIRLDGKAITFVAYNIGGYNYFKLRDIGAALGFGVSWDNATDSIFIDTRLY